MLVTRLSPACRMKRNQQREHPRRLFGARARNGRSPSPEEPVPLFTPSGSAARCSPSGDPGRGVLRGPSQVLRSGQRSAEGVETPRAGSRRGSGTPRPALARCPRRSGEGTSLSHALWSIKTLRRALRSRGCSARREPPLSTARAERSQGVNALKGAGSLRAARRSFTGESQRQVGTPASR